MPRELSRREFIKLIGLGIFAGSTPILRLPSFSSAEPEESDSDELKERDWDNLKKLADNIIPETSVSVNASGAGALNYMKKALDSSYKKLRRRYKRASLTLERIAVSRFEASFSALSDEQAVLCISEFEETRSELFRLLRTHTIEGYFSDPRHGGNKDQIGWKEIRLKSHVLDVDFLN